MIISFGCGIRYQSGQEAKWSGEAIGVKVASANKWFVIVVQI